MTTEVTESQPFKNLKELFDNVGNLKPWPEIKELRDSTDYVYSGLEVSAERMQLEKLDREVQPRTLLCHDMKGGYLEDRFIYGSESYDSYLFYHWSVIDTFVYFSHHFITVPPFGWINVAHNHGVKVLGTVITEREGIWDVILESQEEVRRFADALILVAKFYKFDGWLINVENTIKSEQVNNLIYFVKYLTENIHEAIRNSEIIWYDSVTNEGKLNWQNELNSKNIDFFLNCDGIYLNYNWTKSKLENSLALAKNHSRDIHDIYIGLDIWGRGCPGGGGFNSTYALQKIRHEGLSVAIFGPGWTHEFFGSKTFQEIEDLFWAQLFPYLYVHVPIYEEEVFKTSFCRGSGSLYYRCGEAVYEKDGKYFKHKPFYNLSLQNPQISVPIPHMKFTSSPQLPEPKNENDRNECSKEPIQYVYETRKNVIRVLKNVVNIENKMPMLHVNSFEFSSQFSFEGGGCIKLTTNDLTTRSYHRLFLVHIEFQQDIVAIIAYNEMESSVANGSQHEPILVLGNNTGLKSIVHYKSKNLVANWKKCVYRTNMRTVNEIGISFAKSNVCYLGEIILKQKERHLNDTTSNKSIPANIANVKFDIDRDGQEETDVTISKNNFTCDMLEGGKNTNKAQIAENTVSSISKNSIKLQRNGDNDVKTDVKQDSENLKKDSTPEFPAIKTSSTVLDTLFISNAFNALTLSNNKYVKTAQTLEPVSRTCQEEWIHKQNNLEFAAPKSSILTQTTFCLLNKQRSYGDTSTSQFLTFPTSKSKESACDNAENRSTPFCWKATTTTLSSPTFQVSTASQTLHNSATSKSSILTSPTSSLSKKQYAFGDTSTSQFLTFPTSKSKESACDNAENRSTPFCWKATTTTLSSPTFQVSTASQTLHNSATSKSSILTSPTSSLSKKQYAFGDTSTSQFLTFPTSKSKESACDNAENRSTPFCWKATTTTLSSPTFQVSTASQTLHNSATSKSSILTSPTSSLSKKQYAFGDTSTSQFLTFPTSKSKKSACDNAENRSTPFCWKATTTTLSSPTFQVSTASQTLHNSATSKSSILTSPTSSLSKKQYAFGDTSTSQFLTFPTSKSKESACDNAENRSTPFCWKATTTTLSSPTFQVSTASQTLHNSATSKSSILTSPTSSLSKKQYAFGDTSTSQFLTFPTSKSKESACDNAENRSTPFCWKATTTTLSSPTFQVSTASQTLHNSATSKSSILTSPTSSLSKKQYAFGDTSTSQFLTFPTSKSKESACDNAENRSTPFCWKATTTTLSSPTFQVSTASQTLHNSATSKSSILTSPTSSLSKKQYAFGDTSTSQFLTFPTSKSKESACDNAENRSTPFCWKATTTTLSSPTFQVSTASHTFHNSATSKSSILTSPTSSLSKKQYAFGDTSTSQFLTFPTSKSKESACDNAENRSTPFCWKATTTTLSSPTFQVSTASQTLHNSATSKSSILTSPTSSLSKKQYAFGDTSTSQFLTFPTSKSKESACDNAENRSTPFCWKATTTTLSSPTFQVSTASQTLHNSATSKSSILTSPTSSLSKKQYAFGDTSTSQFLTFPTSKSKESACDNAENRSTPFCWKATTTTLSSPTFQVSTASQTLHNSATSKSSILTSPTSRLSKKQYAFGDTSTSQFLTFPTSKSKESACDNAENRSTPFCWKATTTTLSSPTFQVSTASHTFHNSATSKSSILTSPTSSLSKKQYAFGDTSTSQFLTFPTSKSKESACDNAENRSTPFCWKATTTTLSSPTFQVSTASQTLHNSATSKSSILTSPTSSLSKKQYAFGDTSTSQFLTFPTSKSKESACDNAENRSTPFCWKATTTTLSSPTFQVSTASQTLHNSATSKSSILTSPTSSLSKKQYAFGDTSTSQFLTFPTSKSKESACDNAENRSTPFCWKATTTTLSSPTFQVSTASQTLHNSATSKSSILTSPTSSLSKKQYAFGDTSTSQFLTFPTSKSKESACDNAENRSTPFCWKATTTTLSSPTFQVSTASQTLHNSATSKSSILTSPTSSLSKKQYAFGDTSTSQFLTFPTSKSKESACDNAENRSTPFCWKATTTTLSSPTFQVSTASHTFHNSATSKSSILTSPTSSLSKKQYAFGDTSTSQFLTFPTSKSKESACDNAENRSTPFCWKATTTTLSSPTFQVSTASHTLHNSATSKSSILTSPTSSLSKKQYAFGDTSTSQFLTFPTSKSIESACDNAENRSTPFCWKATTTTLSSPTFQVSTASQTLHNSATSKSSILTSPTASLSKKQYAFGDTSTSQYLTFPTSKSKESACDNAENRSTPFCWKATTTTLSSPAFQVSTASQTLHNSATSKSSILTSPTSSLSKKQYAFGGTSTSQFLTFPTSKSKESACDNAENRSTPFCWKATTTTLPSPTFQVSTASQTLHNSATSKSSILTSPTSSLSKKQYAFGDTSTSQFLTFPTSKGKESACDNAENRSTPFCWKATTTTLSSPTFQVCTASQTLHNSATYKSSILTSPTASLSKKQYAFGDTSTSQFLTFPTSKSKESACDNAENRSTPFCWKATTTTLSSPTFQVSTASQTLHNSATSKSSILTSPTSSLSKKQYAFGDTSTSQFLTFPTSKGKESACDNAENRSTPFCWKATTTTLSSPTFQVSTASQTLHNSATSKSSILTSPTASLSKKQYAFGDTSTSQYLTFPTSKSKESACDNAENRSTPFCWKATTTTLSSPTFQVSTASQTLHNSATSKSSILTLPTFSLSNKQCEFGGAISCKSCTSPVLENKPTACDSTTTNQKETTCNITLGMPTAIPAVFVTLSGTSVVSGNITVRMSTGESTPLIHVHQTFIFNAIPTEAAGMLRTQFNFSTNIKSAVSIENQASIDSPGYTFNGSNLELAAFPQCTTRSSSFFTSQPVTQSQQLSTSSSIPLKCAFNFDSSPGDCTVEPVSIQSEGFNFNPPNTRPSFRFSVYEFNAPIQVQRGTASTQVQRSTASTQVQRKYRKGFRRLK